ncbi:hypothetical protein J4457_00695 [Candidatus Woesearchaeota archaeon]|nr:hypothetical protein [Candidatus Woesearchaeota archaeon]
MSKKQQRKVAVSRKIVVKHPTGLIEVPFETVKSILADVGFAGQLLIKTTNAVFHEVTRIAGTGVVHVADFEKALVKAIKNTNDIVINNTKKLVKQVLK